MLQGKGILNEAKMKQEGELRVFELIFLETFIYNAEFDIMRIYLMPGNVYCINVPLYCMYIF